MDPYIQSWDDARYSFVTCLFGIRRPCPCSSCGDNFKIYIFGFIHTLCTISILHCTAGTSTSVGNDKVSCHHRRHRRRLFKFHHFWCTFHWTEEAPTTKKKKKQREFICGSILAQNSAENGNFLNLNRAFLSVMKLKFKMFSNLWIGTRPIFASIHVCVSSIN